jgi:hypothetical protein
MYRPPVPERWPRRVRSDERAEKCEQPDQKGGFGLPVPQSSS